MNFDWQLYLFIYFAGVICAILMMLIQIVFVFTINWITKTNIFYKNLKKLDPHNIEAGIYSKYSSKLIYFLEPLLSWISVVFIIGRMFYTICNNIRVALQSTPEEIKILNFPLRNNPDLKPEVVWAHLMALRSKNGDIVNSYIISANLKEIKLKNSYFASDFAIENLKRLNVIDPEILSDTLETIKTDKIFKDEFEDGLYDGGH